MYKIIAVLNGQHIDKDGLNDPMLRWLETRGTVSFDRIAYINKRATDSYNAEKYEEKKRLEHFDRRRRIAATLLISHEITSEEAIKYLEGAKSIASIDRATRFNEYVENLYATNRIGEDMFE